MLCLVFQQTGNQHVIYVYGELVFRFRGASTHKFLIDHLLIPLSKHYANNDQPVVFIIELLQLDVEHLLEICLESKEDTKVVTDFTNYLKEYITQYKRRSNESFCTHFSNITVSDQISTKSCFIISRCNCNLDQ